uniref:Paramyosin, isoform E n=1 Tax=Drosophila melanogaster TaxID=7227 RepID=M9NDM6_DROME|nr:paramyosin, isoform E [Drosophila melanogaster]AFH04352.1 paramyosin, isoform E [Drosophila melanogaster]|eukprot:NP_001246681.1 paramyosin, isoform E [Drosophila melanogaster]
MALALKQRPSRFRPTTTTYEDNYGYTMNFYQPMLDYLDAKAKGLEVKKPHLPWVSERGLKQYRPSNAVRQYNADEIVRLSRTCAARADEILLNFRAQKRSPFSVQKLVDASRVTKHLEPDTVVERSRQRRRRRQEELEDLIKRDTLKILQRIRKIELDNELDKMSDDFKRSIRGKSASAIAQALLSESEKNIKTAKKEEEDYIAQTLVRSSRAVSRARSRSSSPLDGQYRAHALHIELMDDRLVDKLDHRVSSSLHNVKRQLSTLNQRTVEFYADSRCGIEDKCWICRKVLRTHPKLKDYSYVYWKH